MINILHILLHLVTIKSDFKQQKRHILVIIFVTITMFYIIPRSRNYLNSEYKVLFWIVFLLKHGDITLPRRHNIMAVFDIPSNIILFREVSICNSNMNPECKYVLEKYVLC